MKIEFVRQNSRDQTLVRYTGKFVISGIQLYLKLAVMFMTCVMKSPLMANRNICIWQFGYRLPLAIVE